MFPCPNCMGQLIFSPKAGRLKCTSCGHYYKAWDYKSPVKIDETGMDTRVYTCPNCAGEIQLIDNDGMEFCPYCGTQATMEEHFYKSSVPQFIIPFAIHKELAKEKYENATKKISFAPDGLNDDENVDKLVGLYMPYFLYDYEVHGDVEYKGERRYTLGDYEYFDKANVKLTYDVEHLQIPYDASQSLDDSISKQLEPFPMTELRPFTPSYLAGFYVENSTVEKELYTEDSAEKALDYLAGQTAKESMNYPIKEGDDKRIHDEVKNKLKSNGTKGAYLPMYFMTTRYGNRVAYSIINGKTGKVYVDMPIEKRKLFASGIGLSVLIFIILIILSFLFSFSYDVKSLCTFAVVVSGFIAYLGAKLSYETYRRDSHMDDKGYFASESNLSKQIAEDKEEPKKKSDKKLKNTMSNALSVLGMILLAMLIFFPFGFLYIGMAIYKMKSIFLIVINLAGYIVSGYLIVLAVKTVKQGDKKVMRLGIISWGLALLIRVINLPNDILYYGALIVVLMVIVASINAIVDEYNRFATHPSPQFLKRGGGLDRA